MKARASAKRPGPGCCVWDLDIVRATSSALYDGLRLEDGSRMDLQFPFEDVLVHHLFVDSIHNLSHNSSEPSL